MSAMGAALILGRLLSGWLSDYMFLPVVAALFVSSPMCGLFLLYVGASQAAVWAASILLGLGTGAEMALLAVLVRHYYGLSAFGWIYGLVFALFNVGSGIGAWLTGFTADIYSSYSNALLINGCTLSVALVCPLILALMMASSSKHGAQFPARTA